MMSRGSCIVGKRRAAAFLPVLIVALSAVCLGQLGDRKAEKVEQEATFARVRELFDEGSSLYDKGKLKEALDVLVKARNLVVTLPNLDLKYLNAHAAILAQIGNVYVKAGNDKEAVRWFEQAIKFFNVLKNSQGNLRQTLDQLAFARHRLGQVDEAARAWIDAAKVLEGVEGATEERARFLKNAGVALYQLRHYDDAAKLHIQAATILETIPNKEFDQAECFNTAAGAYERAAQR